MRRARPRLPVLLGLLVSIVLHALVILPVLVLAMIAPARMNRMPARFDPDDFVRRDTERSPPPETLLGIDAQTPSSLTWVGYREYREHLAALAEVEQAAFRESAPPGGAPAWAQAQAEADQTSPRPDDPEPADAASPLSEADLVAIRQWVEDLRMAQPGDSAATGSADAPAPSDPDARLDELLKRLARAAEAPRATAAPAPTPAPPADATAPSEGIEPTALPQPGEVAAKETDPTSLLEVPLDQIKLGQPIARPGLELRPKRPQFTTLTLLSASPCNPHVRISFGRDGIPADATIVRTSCDARVDHAVENSLYRSRASRALADLREGETLDVRLRIILNPRAR